MLLLAVLAGALTRADAAAPLVLEQVIPLASVSGRIDHLAIDLGRKRLFVAELGNGTVDVIDLATGAAMHRIRGLHEPQGLGFAPKSDVLAVASAGDGSVRLFHGADYTPAGVIDLGEDADNVRLDAATGRFVVGYGSGGLAVIDPESRSVLHRVKLAAHPEGFQLDDTGRRAFVNVPGAREIAVLDMVTGRQVTTWRVPPLGANFPMALDRADALVATVFRNPPRLVLFDTNSGTTAGSIGTCADADDVFFDSRRARIYVSCGEGVVDVLRHQATGYRELARIPTSSGARTSLFVPELDRVFVAARARSRDSGAAVLVFRPVD